MVLKVFRDDIINHIDFIITKRVLTRQPSLLKLYLLLSLNCNSEGWYKVPLARQRYGSQLTGLIVCYELTGIYEFIKIIFIRRIS